MTASSSPSFTDENEEISDISELTENLDSTPEAFICPLTLEVMEDPLMDRRGMNFERRAIVEWLGRGNTTCPLTREPLKYSNLIPNSQLRLRIEQWKRNQGIEVKSSYIDYDKSNKLASYSNNPYGCLVQLSATQGLLNDLLLQEREEDDNDGGEADVGEMSLVDSSVTTSGRNGRSPASRRRSLGRILDMTLSVVGGRRNQSSS